MGVETGGRRRMARGSQAARGRGAGGDPVGGRHEQPPQAGVSAAQQPRNQRPRRSAEVTRARRRDDGDEPGELEGCPALRLVVAPCTRWAWALPARPALVRGRPCARASGREAVSEQSAGTQIRRGGEPRGRHERVGRWRSLLNGPRTRAREDNAAFSGALRAKKLTS